MKNFFNTTINKTTGEVKSDYQQCIIRKVDKKDKSKIDSLTQKYDIKRKASLVPSQITSIKRFSKMLLFVSVVLWILFLCIDIRTVSFLDFMKKELLLEILAILSLMGYIIILFVERHFKKKLQMSNAKQAAENSFQNILNYSLKTLGVQNSFCLEVFSEQHTVKNGNIIPSKKRIFSNVILNVFIEDEQLCFADLYSVIALPIKSFLPLVKVEEPYNFKYWHKEESPSNYKDYGIQVSPKSSSRYAGSYFYILPFKYCKEDYAIFIPPYDLDKWKNLLESKEEKK